MADLLSGKLVVGLAQIAPEWLGRDGTWRQIVSRIEEAAGLGCDLVVFGEALLPGYPFWLAHTDGAAFDSDVQKDLFAWYSLQAVSISDGDLAPIIDAAAAKGVAVYLGCIERAADRGGHSLYCALVYIDAEGAIRSVHRKLVPTYEERLVWSPGDGNGLRTHKLGAFTVGGLNCWENWMPLTRSTLYALGEDLHVAVWPGSERNTRDITRFIAQEARAYVVSVSALACPLRLAADVPHRALLEANLPATCADGGSCVAAPDGSWLLEPVCHEEGVQVVELDHAAVRRARQNFDPSGHYSRPDVTCLRVNRRRQRLVEDAEA